MKTLFLSALLTAGLASLSACATISEDACVAGDWEGIGFTDGTQGRSRARLADISKTCAKYNITPDRSAYLRGLEEGLQRHCTPENGFRRGRQGDGVNNECTVRGFADYADAHAAGFTEYRIERDYRGLIADWTETDEALRDVALRLDDETLTETERARLAKTHRRLLRRADSLRIDIRAMERIHGFPRWRAV